MDKRLQAVDRQPRRAQALSAARSRRVGVGQGIPDLSRRGGQNGFGTRPGAPLMVAGFQRDDHRVNPCGQALVACAMLIARASACGCPAPRCAAAATICPSASSKTQPTVGLGAVAPICSAASCKAWRNPAATCAARSACDLSGRCMCRPQFTTSCQGSTDQRHTAPQKRAACVHLFSSIRTIPSAPESHRSLLTQAFHEETQGARGLGHLAITAGGELHPALRTCPQSRAFSRRSKSGLQGRRADQAAALVQEPQVNEA